MSEWKILEHRPLEGGGTREVRISPAGIVVVEDALPNGTIRHTRICQDGKYGQAIASTPQKAWLAARKLVNRLRPA